MDKNRKRLILASTSPRRIALLEQLGLEFEVKDPGNNEDSSALNPKMRSYENAVKKAKFVADQTNRGIIIGADTIVVVKGSILGKPNNFDESMKMLRSLSGQIHKVITGVAVIDGKTGRMIADTEETLVTIRELSDREITGYIYKGESSDKAGAYAAQGIGAALITRVEGCFYNVVGLPVSKLVTILKEFDVNIL